MPSLEIPCPYLEWRLPGHAGIDGHAALHLNPPDKHRRHTLCLQLSSPFDHWQAGIKQANAWSCRFRNLPFLNLSLGEWQARPGPHRQVPTLPIPSQGSLLTRLKEGTSRRTPLHRRGQGQGGPRLCREVFLGQGQSQPKKKSWTRSVLQIPA